MPQFFVNPQNIKNAEFVINDKNQIKHLCRVLRIQRGENIYLFDNSGKRYLGEVCKIGKMVISGKILKQIDEKEKNIYLRIFPVLINSERFEFLLEKVTEVGVDEIVPCFSNRSIIKLSQEKIQNKLLRWRKIIFSSSKQSNCHRIPKLSEKILKFEDAILSIDNNDLNLIAWEHEDKKSLKDIVLEYLPIKKNFTCNLFIGPEGGFTKKEIDFASGYGFRTFSLGRNTLRSETAAILSCGIISLMLNL